jgi:hypothetical protein
MFAALSLASALSSIPVPPSPPAVRAAADKAFPLLIKGSEGHVEQKTCFACHNQAFPVMAVAAARERGFDLSAAHLKKQAEHVTAFLTSNRDRFKEGKGTGGQVDTAGYALLTLELAGHEPDANTAAVVEYLLKFPGDRPHWRTSSNRPPTEASEFTTTFLALRGLRVWGQLEHEERIAKRVVTARGWLLKTPAKDTEDRVFRLLALKETGADDAAIRAATEALRKDQRFDGGWGQTAAMASDPYATATALVALHRAGGLATDDPAYRRGLAFLVRTQLADGSWYVKSRSKPFQPYYETGFPHGKDQFISSAASGWAATALALACATR